MSKTDYETERDAIVQASLINLHRFASIRSVGAYLEQVANWGALESPVVKALEKVLRESRDVHPNVFFENAAIVLKILDETRRGAGK